MEQLIKEIEKTFSQKEEEFSLEEQKELDFLETFLNSYKHSDPREIPLIDRKNFLLAYLCSQKKGDSFETLQEIVENLSKINEITDYEGLHQIVQLIFKFNDNDSLITEVSEIPLLENDDDKIAEIVTNHQETYKKLQEKDLIDSLSQLHILLSRNLCYNDDGRKAFSYLLNNYTTEFFYALFRIMMLIKTKSDIEEEKPIIVKGKKFENFLKQKLASGKIYEVLEKINERKELLSNKKKEIEKNKKSRNKKLETIKTKLRTLTLQGTITISKDLLKIFPTESSKISLLKYSLFHNRDIFLKIKPDLIREQSLSKLEKLFKKYSFNFSLLTENEQQLLLDNKKIEDIEKMLEILSKKHFHFLKKKTFPIGEILLLSTPTIIANIERLLLQNILPENFILQNLEIFIETINPNIKDEVKFKDAKYKIICENIEHLKEKKFNIRTLANNNKNLLLENPNILEQKLSYLSLYPLNYQKLNNFFILENNNVIKYIDQLIELGFDSILINDPNIINSDIENTIKKILLCNQLEIPTKDEKGKINHNINSSPLRIENITIANTDLDNYIENANLLYENELAFNILETSEIPTSIEIEDPIPQYKNSEITYNINGITISRNKVLRNYQTLKNNNPNLTEEEMLFNSIIHNGIYTTTQLNQISCELDKNKKTKEKK